GVHFCNFGFTRGAKAWVPHDPNSSKMALPVSLTGLPSYITLQRHGSWAGRGSRRGLCPQGLPMSDGSISTAERLLVARPPGRLDQATKACKPLKGATTGSGSGPK